MAAMRIPALLLLLSLAPTQSTPTTTLKSAPLALPLIPLDGSSAYNKTNVTVVLDRKFHTWCSASETLISGHDSFLESLSRALDVGEGNITITRVCSKGEIECLSQEDAQCPTQNAPADGIADKGIETVVSIQLAGPVYKKLVLWLFFNARAASGMGWSSVDVPPMNSDAEGCSAPDPFTAVANCVAGFTCAMRPSSSKLAPPVCRLRIPHGIIQKHDALIFFAAVSAVCLSAAAIMLRGPAWKCLFGRREQSLLGEGLLGGEDRAAARSARGSRRDAASRLEESLSKVTVNLRERLGEDSAGDNVQTLLDQLDAVLVKFRKPDEYDGGGSDEESAPDRTRTQTGESSGAGAGAAGGVSRKDRDWAGGAPGGGGGSN